ncbi:hypothetical protein O181_008506 [Austropuccinia psidii MF-1]|uniref:Reverse transcriptase RNase H-like domain-containing protein n=1 Tax=Austropuccinia psidii MF-1 TaxID=1389203 RepID=A0A9Q3GIK8_9BASI|nr:hypothetical protein [Austropuccinia psidii MF-1]
MFYSILIDFGAKNSFIAKQFVRKYSLTITELPEKIHVIILDSSETPSLFVTHHTKYMVELPSFPSFEWDLLAIDTPKGGDLILGFDFLNHFNPSVDWRQGLITFNADQKDYSDPSTSLSNDFSSAKSFAALVDEVFKEIQDVGEHNYVSSLHLFFWNMDLPPSSYQDSMEEFWDEEEEPEEVETVFKVFTSVYHQYLYVFSKVKAEKLPSHHACDHHIKLEGSLPPVGVIYSLSNQEGFHRHSNPSLPTIGETNASNYALGAVLRQVSDSGKHPTTLNSHKPIPAELNYEIHDKELLGMFWALKRWRAFLLSLSSPFGVLTNHSSLQYFMSSKVLTRHQARLAEFHFSITYCPFCLATLPDALSHQDKVEPQRGDYSIRKNPINSQQLTKQDEFQPSSWKIWPREDSQTFQAGFPLVRLDSNHQGLCLILSTVFKKQEYLSQEVWIAQTSCNSKWSLDLSLNGLHHSTATIQFL